MVSENVIRLFQPEEGRLIGLKCFDNKLYALPVKENLILVYEKNNAGGYSLLERIPLGVKNASGITADGKTLFVADRIEKTVYCMDLNTKQTRLYLSMRELKESNGDTDYVINSRNSTINDLEINNGEMWITCSAGYSSCIYRIDTNSRKVIKVISARGPEPKSISFDAAEKCMRVLDSSNREISSFSLEGEWTGQFVKIPVDSPACFSIDPDSNLVISSHRIETNRKNRGV